MRSMKSYRVLRRNNVKSPLRFPLEGQHRCQCMLSDAPILCLFHVVEELKQRCLTPVEELARAILDYFHTGLHFSLRLWVTVEASARDIQHRTPHVVIADLHGSV